MVVGRGVGETFFSATGSAREETQATSPFSAVSRGFPRRQEARVLGALGKAARPRPSACAVAPGLASVGAKVGWWPGRAGRRGMQIRIRATGWAIIDSARPSSGPEEEG